MPGYKFREKNGKKRIKDRFAKSPVFQILYPVESSSFTSGDICNIIWNSSNIDKVYGVKIELYQNDVFASVISDGTQNDGLYEWTVPQLDGTNYQIKLTSLVDNIYYDFSDYFVITLDATLTLLSPNGSEQWISDNYHNITWTGQYVIGHIKIELYKDDVLYSVIAESVDYELLSYGWQIPFLIAESENFKIKITNVENTSLNDISDDYFEIEIKKIWILTNKYYGSDVPTKNGWILTNYKYEENTSSGTYPNGWLLSNLNEEDSDADGYVLFDGSNDYISIKDTLLTFGTKWSVALWYNPNNVSMGTNYLLNNETALNPGISFAIYTNKFSLIIEKGVSTTEIRTDILSTELAGTEWHSVIVNVDHTNATANDRVRIYVDGTDRTSIITADNGDAYTNPKSINYKIGYRYNGAYMQALKLKNYIICSDILTPAQIANFHAGNIESIDNKVVWYKCNEADWSLFLKDYSGNGNHGYPQNINYETFYNRS